jgi:hypothetical protein
MAEIEYMVPSIVLEHKLSSYKAGILCHQQGGF